MHSLARALQSSGAQPARSRRFVVMSRGEPNVGDHISVSRVRRYAQCPKSFELHYVAGRTSQPNASLVFGKVLHAALERTYRQIVADRISGRFPIALLIAAYRY